MVKLRLRRMGAINQPSYRIVVVDSRQKRDGKYLECVGWYDPKPNPSKINIDTERALYWLSVGAQPSDTVRSLLRKAGVLQIWHESKVKKNQITAEAE
ncbi:MAG: 30S ribosomal protein S16 [Candidatus Cloacimonas sp.]|nr:30S ribosomal protein S16 [Candidatus Cloacimonas sp.]